MKIASIVIDSCVPHSRVCISELVTYVHAHVLLLLQIMLIDGGCNVMDAEWSAIIHGVRGGFLPHSAKRYMSFHPDHIRW